MSITVCHLVDDDGFGGVNRGLEHIVSDKTLSEISTHEVVRIKRGKLTPPPISADVIISKLSICWANMPLFLALRFAHPNTPIVHFEHSYSERFVASSVRNHNRFSKLMRKAFSLFDRVVAVSDEQAAWLLRRGFVNEAKLQVINSCPSLKPFLNVEPRTTPDKIIVGAIGRLHIQKGFDVLIKGFRKAARSDMELHIYGDGPQRAYLEKLAEGDPAIIFKGYEKDTSLAMAAVDVVAMPSRWEPYGLVAIEAMAARRALICSNADGLAGHIRRGALEVGDNTTMGWAERLKMVSRDDLRRNLESSYNHASRAEERFSHSWFTLLKQVAC